MGYSRQVSWELFLISEAESCTSSPANTHSGTFLPTYPSFHQSFPILLSEHFCSSLTLDYIPHVLSSVQFAVVAPDRNLTHSSLKVSQSIQLLSPSESQITSNHKSFIPIIFHSTSHSFQFLRFKCEPILSFVSQISPLFFSFHPFGCIPHSA